MPDPSHAVDWRPWGPEAFDTAGADQRPVLLGVGVSWSLGCAQMLRTTYRDPAVLELIERHFIPVWVDAEERPDINDRYNLGGWPTTAFLTSDGQILGGQTFTESNRMVDLLRQVSDAYAARQEELAPGPPQPPPASAQPTPEGPPRIARHLEAWLGEYLRDAFDPAHGGFGRAAKRIDEAPLLLALAGCRGEDSAMCQMATQTLDAIGWGPLFDDVDGGVFRYAEGRDWSQPHVEKLLGVNAGALRLFLEAWDATGDRRYRDRALEVLRYVRETLADHSHGGFFASQQADDLYYEAEPADRSRLRPPSVDRVLYTGANSQMARAYLRAAELLDDGSLLDFAVLTVERVVGQSYARGEGIGHRVDTDQPLRGLLDDQVSVSEVLCEVYAATDRDVYLDLAQELMLFATRSLSDGRSGALVDRAVAADDVGLLRHPITPFALNCRAARMLARLGHMAGRADLREQAGIVLASQTSTALLKGVEAAEYVLALQALGPSEPS
jgi:hypothetical protein